jgi:hypothetical protein
LGSIEFFQVFFIFCELLCSLSPSYQVRERFSTLAIEGDGHVLCKECPKLGASIAHHHEHHGDRVCSDELGKSDLAVAAGVMSAILSMTGLMGFCPMCAMVGRKLAKRD